MRNIHWSVQLAMLLGLVGLFVLRVSFWLGALMILVGLVVSILALRQPQKMASPVPKSVGRIDRPTAAQHALTSHPVDRQKLGVLRYTLHRSNLDSNAPVFETDDHKIVTVRDILMEMIDIAETHGRSVEELARDIVAMYPRIFDNAALALDQYPDEELAKTYIARKSMTDVHWKVDEPDANVRKRQSR